MCSEHVAVQYGKLIFTDLNFEGFPGFLVHMLFEALVTAPVQPRKITENMVAALRLVATVRIHDKNSGFENEAGLALPIIPVYLCWT